MKIPTLDSSIVWIRRTVANRIAVGIVILVVVIMIFQAGMLVGYRKAAFSYHLHQNYFQNFGEAPGAMGFMGDRNAPNSHGSAGVIVSVASDAVTVSSPGRAEQVIKISSSTEIRKLGTTITEADLMPGNFIIVIGEPNTAGEIEARLVRVMPSPPTMASGTPMTH
jgi:hypothetical protein